MNHDKTIPITLATLLALLLLAPCATAERHGPRDGRTGERLHERMVELRSRLLHERVGLDSVKIARVEALLQKGDAERKALHTAMKESRRTLRDLVDDDAADQKAFDVAVGALLKTRHRLHQLRHEELSKLRRVLEPKEMGKLVLALGRLRHRLDRMRDGRRRRGGDEMRRGPRGDKERRGRRGRRRHRDDW